jgi:hypothetical protein
MRINIKRTLGATSIAVALGLVALFAYRAQVNDTQSATASERHSARKSAGLRSRRSFAEAESTVLKPPVTASFPYGEFPQ